jgi:hypothetical protein
MTDLNTTETTEVTESFYSDEIELLTSAFAKLALKNQLKSSAFLTVSQIDAKKYPKLKSLFTEVLEFFGVTDFDVPFLKFYIDDDVFKGIRFPVLGVVGKDMALMMGDKSYVVSSAWSKKDNGKSLRFVEKNKSYFAFINSDNVELAEIQIPVYLNEQDKEKSISLTKLVSLPFALANIAPLSFSTSSLQDGKYDIVSFVKKGNRCSAIINEKGTAKNCFITDYVYKNLVICKDEGRENIRLVVDGFTTTKKGTFRNVFVEGFPPLNFKKFGALIEEHLLENGIEYSLIDLCPSYKLKEEDIDKLTLNYAPGVLPEKEKEAREKVEKDFKKLANENSSKVFPIKFKLDGIQKVEKTQNNDVGAYLIINYSGIQYHVGLSSSMKRDYTNGVLDLDNFDNCYVIINGIGTWQAYFTYFTQWEIPTQQMNLDGVDELEAMMF